MLQKERTGHDGLPDQPARMWLHLPPMPGQISFRSAVSCKVPQIRNPTVQYGLAFNGKMEILTEVA